MKKLPFKPTALRKAAPKPSQPEESKESDDDGLALFRRRKEMAPIMAADLERRLKKRRAAEEEEERRRLQTTGEKRTRDDSEDAKDSEIPIQGEPSNAHEGPSSAQLNNETPIAEPASTQDGHDQTRSASLLHNLGSPSDQASELVTPPPSKRSRLDSNSTQKPMLSAQLDDDDDDDEHDPFPDASPTPRARPQPGSPSPIRSRRPELTSAQNQVVQSITIDSDSDDEVRPTQPTRRRSSSIEATDRTSTKFLKETTPPPVAEEDDEFAEYIRKAQENRARQQALQSPNTNESPKKESISVMITSSIPNSGTLVARFLFDKQLRVARNAWVSHQRKKGLQLNTDDIILTWRRTKIYNTSTLNGLGIRPCGNGRVEADGLGSAGFSNNRSVVHIEAWTPELFQEMEQNEELQRRRDAGELSDEEEPQQEEREKFIITLKARDIQPLECKVMPETTVDTLIAVFRKQRQIGPDKEVSLWWDGDRLEEHIEMEQAEIEEHDTIEVHVQ
jgi:hypothetical protein